jgi:hypothetical protein
MGMGLFIPVASSTTAGCHLATNKIFNDEFAFSRGHFTVIFVLLLLMRTGMLTSHLGLSQELIHEASTGRISNTNLHEIIHAHRSAASPLR